MRVLSMFNEVAVCAKKLAFGEFRFYVPRALAKKRRDGKFLFAVFVVKLIYTNGQVLRFAADALITKPDNQRGFSRCSLRHQSRPDFLLSGGTTSPTINSASAAFSLGLRKVLKRQRRVATSTPFLTSLLVSRSASVRPNYARTFDATRKNAVCFYSRLKTAKWLIASWACKVQISVGFGKIVFRHVGLHLRSILLGLARRLERFAGPNYITERHGSYGLV